MRIYRYFQFLGLDIVLGALASSCFASRLFQARPGMIWWITLALTVWLLYTGDHMLDAWRQRKKVKREMHQFLLRHRKVILYALGVVAAVDVILVLNLLEREVFKFALILAGLVLLFYAMRHVFRKNRVLFIPGEFFVLLLYLAGTWLGPVVMADAVFESSQALVALLFAAVLLMNLGVISLYDLQLDSRMGISSLAQILGKKSTRNLLITTGVGIYLASLLEFLVFESSRYTQFALILCGMASILLLEVFLPSRFRRNDVYRWTADGVLFMGFLSLLIRG